MHFLWHSLQNMVYSLSHIRSILVHVHRSSCLPILSVYLCLCPQNWGPRLMCNDNDCVLVSPLITLIWSCHVPVLRDSHRYSWFLLTPGIYRGMLNLTFVSDKLCSICRPNQEEGMCFRFSKLKRVDICSTVYLLFT